jgi:hypothetical protein
MFHSGKRYLTKKCFGSGIILFFILLSSLSIAYISNASNASAFMNSNLIGPFSSNNPIVVAPINPSMNSFYGGGVYSPGYGGGLGYGGGGFGGPSFGTGLIGLLPQVLGLNIGNDGFGLGYGGGGFGGPSFGTGLIGLLPQGFNGIGSQFSQGPGLSFDNEFNSGDIFSQPLQQSNGLSGILGGIGSLFSQGPGLSIDNGGYDNGYNSDNDQSITEFNTSNDPFLSTSDSDNDQSSSNLDDSDSSSTSPLEDLRSIDSSSFSSSDDPFSSTQDSDSSQSFLGDLF